jgi:uncharacterized membrane protein
MERNYYSNYDGIKENSELKRDAALQLRGNWGTAILISLIAGIISSSTAISILIKDGSGRSLLSNVLNLVLGGPISLGLAICFLMLMRNRTFRLENLFEGFKNFKSAFLLNLLIQVFVVLWSILLIIPGVMAYYSYAMSFYVLSDNPDMSALDAIKESQRLMQGFKWKLFCLHISFIGWILLSFCTFFVGMLWIYPYIKTSEAYFYQNLKDMNQKRIPVL